MVGVADSVADQGTSDSPTPFSSDSEANVRMLTDMGFTEAAARSALRLRHDDLDLAMEYLLSADSGGEFHNCVCSDSVSACGGVVRPSIRGCDVTCLCFGEFVTGVDSGCGPDGDDDIDRLAAQMSNVCIG